MPEELILMEEVTNEWRCIYCILIYFDKIMFPQNCKEMDLYTNFTTSKKNLPRFQYIYA